MGFIFLPSYINFWPVVFAILCWQTDEQTHRQIDRRREKQYLLAACAQVHTMYTYSRPINMRVACTCFDFRTHWSQRNTGTGSKDEFGKSELTPRNRPFQLTDIGSGLISQQSVTLRQTRPRGWHGLAATFWATLGLTSRRPRCQQFYHVLGTNACPLSITFWS